MPRACGTLISSLRGRVYHAYSLIGASNMGNLNAEFIAINSFKANVCLRNNQDGYRSKSVTAKGDLNIWKLCLPILNLAYPARAVHRVVQRKQFTFVFRFQNLCENAVSWQRQSASGD